MASIRGIDRRIVGVTVLIILFGLVMLYSASAPFSLRYYGSSTSMVLLQALAAVAGVIALFVLAAFDYHRLARLSDVLLIGAFGLTVLTVLPIGIANGRWLSLGFVEVQPTEFLKLALLLYLAAVIDRKGERMRSFASGVVPCLVVLAVIALVVINQPDLGMILLYGVLTAVLLFAGGARPSHLGAIGVCAVPAVYLAVRMAPYRFARLLSFLQPEAYRSSLGYQTLQSLTAIGSGGILGRGLGESRAKLFYLPQAHNDFIISVVAEELGLVGVVFVLGLIGLVVWRAFVVSERAPDRLGRLLAIGIGFSLGFQALVNTGVALGVLPVTGLTFPFLSNGGSSLLVSLAMIGVLLNVSKQGGTL